jgi:hypothetical protein
LGIVVAVRAVMKTTWFASIALLFVTLVGTPRRAFADPPSAVAVVVPDKEQEADTLLSSGRFMRRTGISMTIIGVAGLALGTGLLIEGLSLRPDESNKTAVEYVGGTLMAAGILEAGIGVPLWVAGQTRLNRSRELVAQPFLAPGQGRVLAGFAVVF